MLYFPLYVISEISIGHRKRFHIHRCWKKAQKLINSHISDKLKIANRILLIVQCIVVTDFDNCIM